MRRKRRRLIAVLAGLACLGFATALVLYAFNDNLVFFKTPTDLVTDASLKDRRVRIGGLVEDKSIAREDGGKTLRFRITDGNNTVPVTYTGVIPDLFREGQGVVAEGSMDRGTFRAATLLAKHDEKYMPPEVAEALKKSGHWQEGGPPPGTSSAKQ